RHARRNARAAGAQLRARAARARARRARADDDGAARLPRLEQPAPNRPRHAVALGVRRRRQLREDGQRPALLELAAADRHLHRDDGRAAGRRRPRARAPRAADPEGAGAPARRRDPADRARAGCRRPVLANAGARPRRRPRRHGDSRARLGQSQLARRPAARADLGDRDPHLAVDAVRVPGAARDALDAAARCLRSRAARPRRRVAALLAPDAAADPPRGRDGRDPPDDDRALGVRGDLRRDRRRPGFGDRDPQPLRVPDVVFRAQPRLRRIARGRAASDHDGDLVRDVPSAEGAPVTTTGALPRPGRAIALYALAGAVLAVWAFPVVWGLLTSFKTERDVLAYPPVWIFTPTLANYRDVLFGPSSIVPNLFSSLVVASLATALTLVFGIPAAYAMARLRFPAKKTTGFYVLATQMLPPVGLIIPYYLALQKVGGLDTYAGLVVIDLTFSLPFAIWLLVSYFEDVPVEMEEAALLDRAGRVRALWHVILPQVKGGIAVTT